MIVVDLVDVPAGQLNALLNEHVSDPRLIKGEEITTLQFTDTLASGLLSHTTPLWALWPEFTLRNLKDHKVHRRIAFMERKLLG